jgi:hypothetical protein
VIWVCVKTYSVMSDLSSCEHVFCNEWSESEYVFTQTQITHYRLRFHTNSYHSLQITFSYKLRSLITDYVFTQTQTTHYRIRFHTNSDHSLQNTFSHKLRLLITEYVFTQTEITHYRIRFQTNWDHFITEYVFTQTQITHYRIHFHTNSDHSLENTISHKLRWLDLCLCENVFCNEWSEFVWQRIL